jgi:tRNA(adenine34) deaminase
MDDNYYMKYALIEAKKAFLAGEVPIGAVIVKNGNIIAKAHNLKEKKNDVTCHAEILAIKKASLKLKNWRLNDCTMFITLFPCPMCASAINQSRISKVVYGAIPEYVDKSIINSILNDKFYGNSVEIVENSLKNECLELLQNFFKKKRQ